MSRKINKIPKERLFKDTMRTVTEDNIAIRKVQKQQGQAVTELAVDVGLMKSCFGTMSKIEAFLWKEIKEQKKKNRELRDWLTKYIIALFVMVVVFMVFLVIKG